MAENNLNGSDRRDNPGNRSPGQALPPAPSSNSNLKDATIHTARGARVDTFTFEVIDNKILIAAIEASTRSSSAFPYLEQLLNNELRSYDLYLWGGAARDPVNNVLIGTNLQVRDFDLLAYDQAGQSANLKQDLGTLPNLAFSSLGSPKWKPAPGIEIDIVPFQNAVADRSKPLTLEASLRNGALSTSGFAYDLRNKILYNFGGLETIQERAVYQISPLRAPIDFARAILHAEKMNIQLSAELQQTVASHYQPEMAQQVRDYLKYKKMEDKAELVLKALNGIIGN